MKNLLIEFLFLKKAPNKKVDVILCELTRGKKKYTDVREKIKQSGKIYIYCTTRTRI